MEPKFVERPAFTAVGLEYTGRNENNEIAQLWGQIGPRLKDIEDVKQTDASYGFTTAFDEASGAMTYVAAYETEGTAEPPEGMVRIDVPAQKYAVFTCTMPKIQEVYGQIYGEWLPQSGYQHAPSPEFELYDTSLDWNDPTSEFEIYIPVIEA